MEFSMKNSVTKALSKLQTGAKRQIQIGAHPLQGTWDKEVAYFQDTKTPCQSIKASLKASLKTYRIFIDVF